MFTLVLSFTSDCGVQEFLEENGVEISADKKYLGQYIVVCYCYQETCEKIISQLEGTVRFNWYTTSTQGY